MALGRETVYFLAVRRGRAIAQPQSPRGRPTLPLSLSGQVLCHRRRHEPMNVTVADTAPPFRCSRLSSHQHRGFAHTTGFCSLTTCLLTVIATGGHPRILRPRRRGAEGAAGAIQVPRANALRRGARLRAGSAALERCVPLPAAPSWRRPRPAQRALPRTLAVLLPLSAPLENPGLWRAQAQARARRGALRGASLFLDADMLSSAVDHLVE